jgi:NIPSNAP protein
MKRREFLAASCVAGLTGLKGASGMTYSGVASRDYYELRKYTLETQGQKTGFDSFMAEAMIPALNRIGINPVGVFEPEEGIEFVYVLLRHKTMDSIATATQKLLADKEYLSKGASFLNAPASNPAYARVESSILAAFAGMPAIEKPVKSSGRVVQLRIYESPSVKTGQKKIEMFNRSEIDIFRKTGLHPVFFGEALSGVKLPNLTYMLMFKDRAEQKANWRKFGSHPDWKKLKSIPGYADKKILCGITNLNLKSAKYSQV